MKSAKKKNKVGHSPHADKKRKDTLEVPVKCKDTLEVPVIAVNGVVCDIDQETLPRARTSWDDDPCVPQDRRDHNIQGEKREGERENESGQRVSLGSDNVTSPREVSLQEVSVEMNDTTRSGSPNSEPRRDHSGDGFMLECATPKVYEEEMLDRVLRMYNMFVIVEIPLEIDPNISDINTSNMNIE